MPPPVDALVENLFRRQAGQITARLVRRFGAGHLQLAEDIAQESLLRALSIWPWRGVPENPAGWLHAVAHRLAIDAVRRDIRLQQLLPDLESVAPPDSRAERTSEPDEDDELQLLFMCAHPALTPDMRVPLMLNVACGFSAAEVAHGLLRETPAVAQTLTRAKRRLREKGAPLAAPMRAERADRLASVIDALHLMFSEGYEASNGESLTRSDICSEALRLAELLTRDRATATPQCHALAGLFCFQLARLASRVDVAGELVPLAEQDRSLWDRSLIARGFRHLEAAGSGPELSEHHLLAAIAAEHVRAPDYGRTDWPALLIFYDLLLQVAPSPIHRLNRAVALAETGAIEAALCQIEAPAIEKKLQFYGPYHTTLAELLRRVGRTVDAISALQRALVLARSSPTQRLLRRRLATLQNRAPETALH